MKNYHGIENIYVDSEVMKSLYPQMTYEEIRLRLARFCPSSEWDDCYPVMDELLKIITGVTLNADGSATGLIGGKEQTAHGGHCRAICILFLMAKDEGDKS